MNKIQEKHFGDLLKAKKLSKTKIRIVMLDFFTKANYAYSLSDIEKEFHNVYDRITVYRTLKTFESKGIIHEVIDNSNMTKYAYCKHEECHEHEHHDVHPHFKCTVCKKTKCVDEAVVQPIQLPLHYTISSVNVLLTGICPLCQEK